VQLVARAIPVDHWSSILQHDVPAEVRYGVVKLLTGGSCLPLLLLLLLLALDHRWAWEWTGQCAGDSTDCPSGSCSCGEIYPYLVDPNCAFGSPNCLAPEEDMSVWCGGATYSPGYASVYAPLCSGTYVDNELCGGNTATSPDCSGTLSCTCS
jgi:hypothetical protein